MNKYMTDDAPVFPIRTAAGLLKISIPTLRMYEREGLIVPYKKDTNHRLYSKSDLERIECIRRAINELKISINGIKLIYSLIPCWDIVGCSSSDKEKCPAFQDHHGPCWTVKPEASACTDRKCRQCVVYKDYAECGKIKESIKKISGSKEQHESTIEKEVP